MSYSHTADYYHLDTALKFQWREYSALREEMENFEPRPLSDFSDDRDAQINYIRDLNPDTPESEIEMLVDKAFGHAWTPEGQFYTQFDARHMTLYVSTVILSHFLCEALINVILAVGLYNSGSVELFKVMEKSDFRQKWLVCPKSLSATYEFPRGTALHETLNFLSGQRNAIVHNKVTLHADGQKVLDGSSLNRSDYRTEMDWVWRFLSLPYDLANFARKVIPGPHMYLMERNPIKIAPAHKGIII